MRTFTSALVGAAVATIVVSGSLAIAAIPDSTTKVITGCYKKTTGELRVIDKATKGACNVKTEVELGWNQQGIKGDPGIAGLNGLPGKDASGDVMYDATGAVVGTPVYLTSDTFWTGQYMVRYDLQTGKLVRKPKPTANVYLTADCTGQAFILGDADSITPFVAQTVPTLFGHPIPNVDTTDLGSGWIATPSTYWVQWVYGSIDSGKGNNWSTLTDRVTTPGLPFRLDASGSCAPMTYGTNISVDALYILQSVALSGLRDNFTGPIAPALSAMPAP